MSRDRFPVSINGRRFAIDLTGYRRVSIDPQRAMVDQSGDVGEQTLMQPGQWKRTGYDWSHGAGQQLFDVDDETDRRRFRESLGVDVWDRRYLTLLPATTEAQDEASIPTGYINNYAPDKLLRYRGYLYAFCNHTRSNAGTSSIGWRCYFVAHIDGLSSDPYALDLPWGFDTTDSFANDTNNYITDALEVLDEGIVCAAGDLYHLFGTNLLSGDRSSHSLTKFTTDDDTGTPNNHWWAADVGGRVLTAGPDKIQEVSWASHTSTALSVTVVDSWDTLTQQATCIEGAPMGAFVGMRNGIDDQYLNENFGEPTGNRIGHIAIDPDSTAFIAPRTVAELPDGERVNTLLYYRGFLVIGTSKGVRIATVESSGDLAMGPLIRVAGIVSDWEHLTGVLALYADEDYVYFSWANPDGNRTGIGRLDPSEFTETLVPAYATDLMTPASDAKQGVVTSIASAAGRLWFAVNNLDEDQIITGSNVSSIYVETLDKVPSGTLSTGRISFGTAETKRYTGLELAADPLPAGATIVGDLVEPDGTTTEIVSMSTTDDTFERGAVDDVGAEWTEVQLELTRATDTTVSPKLDRWTLRAVPVPDRIEEIWLPVMLSSVVRHESGPDVPLDTWTEFAWLKALLESRAVVPFVMGSEELSVYVDGIYTGEQAARIADWVNDETWVQGTWLVKLTTVPDGASTVVPVTAGNAMQQSARGAANGVASLDADAEVPDAQLGSGIERRTQGRPHGPEARQWTKAKAVADSQPARVLVLSDSATRFMDGMRSAWRAIHRALTTDPVGDYLAPYAANAYTGASNWETVTGGDASIGIDFAGATLTVGDGEIGFTSTEIEIPTTVRVIYDADPSACDLEVRIAGVLVDTIEGDKDQDGNTVGALTEAQLWESSSIGAPGTVTVKPVGSGSIGVHAIVTPPASGIEWYGLGYSGQTVPQLLSQGRFEAFLQAMVDRGETPDLILVSVENGDDGRTLAQYNTDHTDLLAAIDAITTTPTLALMIYPDIGLSDWAERYPQQLDHAMENGHVLIDLCAALGDISGDTSVSGDGVHITTAKGRRIVDRVVGDALLGGWAEPDALRTYVEEQTDRVVRYVGAAFDPTTDETQIVAFAVPAHWQTYDVRVAWYHLGGTAATGVRWAVSAITIADGESMLGFEGQTAAVTATAPAQLVADLVTVASGFAVPSTGLVTIGLTRDANHAADTLAVDATVLTVELIKAS